MNVKVVSFIVVLVLIISFPIGLLIAFPKRDINTSYNREQAIEKLNNASAIEVSERFSIGQYYEILVDEEIVATVQGKKFHIFGDTFTMYSSDGSLIGSESEEILHLNHQAVFRDYNGNEVFHMSDKLISIGHKLNLYDTNDNLIGKSEQEILHFLRKDNYFNSSDELIWKSSKNFSLMGSYTIERVSDSEDTLGAVNVVFLNCIEDALDKPTNNTNTNSKSNSRN